MTEFKTCSEVATLVGVNYSTISRWSDKGILPKGRHTTILKPGDTQPRRCRVYSLQEVQDIIDVLRERGLTPEQRAAAKRLKSKRDLQVESELTRIATEIQVIATKFGRDIQGMDVVLARTQAKFDSLVADIQSRFDETLADAEAVLHSRFEVALEHMTRTVETMEARMAANIESDTSVLTSRLQALLSGSVDPYADIDVRVIRPRNVDAQMGGFAIHQVAAELQISSPIIRQWIDAGVIQPGRMVQQGQRQVMVFSEEEAQRIADLVGLPVKFVATANIRKHSQRAEAEGEMP